MVIPIAHERTGIRPFFKFLFYSFQTLFSGFEESRTTQEKKGRKRNQGGIPHQLGVRQKGRNGHDMMRAKKAEEGRGRRRR